MIRSPLVIALLTLFTLAVVSGIGGEFPLNDDWQYAHVARQFAESGVFKVDVAVAPTLWIQSALGALAIRAFGFSHLILRLLTLAFSCGVVALVDRLLVMNKVSRGMRVLTLLTLVTQPLFFYLSTSFMTEHYGLFFGLAGAVAWFSGKKKTGALLMGVSFWVRQFSVLVFPAILMAEFLKNKAKNESYFSFFKRYFSEITLFVLPVIGYFPWARWTGNYNPAFSGPFRDMLIPAPGFWLTQAPIAIYYFTWFSSPLLLLEWASQDQSHRVKDLQKRFWVLWGVLATAAAVIAFTARDSYRVLDKIHRVFPFLGNILTPYGVGPITLTDVYWGENPVQPDAHPGFWILIEIVLIVLAAAWVIRWRRRSQNHLESTLTDFALIFTFLTFFTAVQAYHYAIFDRYYEPALIGCLIWLSAGSVNLAETTRRMKGALTFILLFFAVFSVAGVHDLFAWNHSRWALFQRAVSRGVAISEIDGGYELNGWFAFEEGRPNAVSPGCGLVQPWYCGHRSYQIVMGAGNDAVVVDSEPVRSWMGRYPDLQLIRISK